MQSEHSAGSSPVQGISGSAESAERTESSSWSLCVDDKAEDAAPARHTPSR